SYPNSSSEMSIEFDFTGTEFTLVYDSIPSSMDYELFVDNISQGVFHTTPPESGNEYGNQRKHTFDFVRNKKIRIVTRYTGVQALQTIRITGIIVNKKIRISNQGIIGTSARLYIERNLDAVQEGDSFVFIQLGTNDRLILSGVAKG